MKFLETELQGAFLIEPTPFKDERGFFCRTYCQQAFSQWGLQTNLKQCNLSYNYKKGTLRGMHFQEAPFAEAKLVRCTSGSVYDVIIDLRPSSPTYTKWTFAILSAENRKMLYIPEGFAHGFQTLQDDVELFYQMSEEYYANYARGVRWNDKAFQIAWPLEVAMISDKDNLYPDFIS